jgi:plasmid stability protein
MTVGVPSDLEQQLKVYSSQRGKTEEQALEEILRQALGQDDASKPERRSWVALANSGVGDLSERVNELLFTEGLRGKS